MTNPFYLSMRLYSLYGLAICLHEKINDTLPHKTKATPQEKSKARFQIVEVAQALRHRLNELNTYKPNYAAFEAAIGMPVIILRTSQKGTIVGLNASRETVMVQFDHLALFQDYKPEDFMFTLPKEIRDYADKMIF